jgi:hypothetical protein
MDFARGRVTIRRWRELAELGMFNESYLHVMERPIVEHGNS